MAKYNSGIKYNSKPQSGGAIYNEQSISIVLSDSAHFTDNILCIDENIVYRDSESTGKDTAILGISVSDAGYARESNNAESIRIDSGNAEEKISIEAQINTIDNYTVSETVTELVADVRGKLADSNDETYESISNILEIACADSGVLSIEQTAGIDADLSLVDGNDLVEEVVSDIGLGKVLNDTAEGIDSYSLTINIKVQDEDRGVSEGVGESVKSFTVTDDTHPKDNVREFTKSSGVEDVTGTKSFDIKEETPFIVKVETLFNSTDLQKVLEAKIA